MRIPKNSRRDKDSQRIGCPVRQTRFAARNPPLDPLQKGTVEERKAGGGPSGASVKKRMRGVEERLKGKEGEKEKIEEMDEFVIRGGEGLRDFFRREGKESVKRQTIREEKRPAEAPKRIP